MLLRDRCSHGAYRDSNYTGWFAGPCTLTVRPRRVVERVLEHTRDRSIVFGRNEQDTVRFGDLFLQAFDGLRLVRVIVLVVQRQVTDLCLLEQKLCRRESGHRACQLAIKGITAKASDDYGDPVLTHVILQKTRLAAGLLTRPFGAPPTFRDRRMRRRAIQH